jgi:hypothetical protein
MINKTIPAIYGSLVDIGFNISPIFIKEDNDWYILNSKPTKQSDYDMFIMNENGMCKSLPVEHEYKDQDACLLYFESDTRQLVFDQQPWLQANDFELFSKPNKVWYKLGKRSELKKLKQTLIYPVYSKVKEYWNKNIGSPKDYLCWGTLLNSCDSTIEYIIVYIAFKQRFRFKTQEDLIQDSEFWLGRLETEEEKEKTISLLKELGVSLEKNE